MCKHKSGGMSNPPPSGTTPSSQDAQAQNIAYVPNVEETEQSPMLVQYWNQARHSEDDAETSEQQRSCSPESSISSCEVGSPTCKICHTAARDDDPLISPCRCSGTMQYIHCGCLMRWLEVCHRRGRRPASCELCQYQYHWHKKFRMGQWRLPSCSGRDKVLHGLFFLSVLVMVCCASLTVLCFRQETQRGTTDLTRSEVVTLACGVLFFLAFFVAMYVEVKSRDTLYRLFVRFVHINQQWYIDEYQKPVPV